MQDLALAFAELSEVSVGSFLKISLNDTPALHNIILCLYLNVICKLAVGLFQSVNRNNGKPCKRLDAAKVNNNHCCPLGYTATHFIIEVYQVDHMKFALGKSVLGVVSHILLHMPSSEKDLLHNLPKERS